MQTCVVIVGHNSVPFCTIVVAFTEFEMRLSTFKGIVFLFIRLFVNKYLQYQ